MQKMESKPKSSLMANSFVTCYEDYFVIHLYYFPFGNKKVNYSSIQTCELRSTNELDIFSQKHWGMAFTPVWWHCDMKRFQRKHYLLINANQWPKIGITMNDDEIFDFYDFIRRKMREHEIRTFAEEKRPFSFENETQNTEKK